MLRRTVGRRRGPTKTPAIVVAVDLKKAFDTVSHARIVEVLSECGAGPRITNFVKGFLKDRTFEINTDSHQPQTFTNVVGVPQGAILSPMLFNLVMRDIAGELETIENLKHTVYADDITIWTDGSTDVKTVTEAVQRGLDAIERGLAATGMRASSEKTQYIVLGGVEQTRETVDIRLGGRRIERAASRWIRILGVPLHEQGIISIFGTSYPFIYLNIALQWSFYTANAATTPYKNILFHKIS